MRGRFEFLSPRVREEVARRLGGVGEAFGLGELYYDSFTRRYGRRVCAG